MKSDQGINPWVLLLIAVVAVAIVVLTIKLSGPTGDATAADGPPAADREEQIKPPRDIPRKELVDACQDSWARYGENKRTSGWMNTVGKQRALFQTVEDGVYACIDEPRKYIEEFYIAPPP